MNAALDLPDLIASRYVPIRLIAKGGMGAVYEVEHVRTGERLALKVLLAGVGASAETQERFKREARASARIKSENVVRVTDADVAPELGGAAFLVMELLEGADLERHTAVRSPEASRSYLITGRSGPFACRRYDARRCRRTRGWSRSNGSSTWWVCSSRRSTR